MRQRASIRDDRWWVWAGGGYLRGRPADDHWMNSPSSGQHTAHYSPVIIAPFVAWGRRGSLPLFFWRGGRKTTTRYELCDAKLERSSGLSAAMAATPANFTGCTTWRLIQRATSTRLRWTPASGRRNSAM